MINTFYYTKDCDTFVNLILPLKEEAKELFIYLDELTELYKDVWDHSWNNYLECHIVSFQFALLGKDYDMFFKKHTLPESISNFKSLVMRENMNKLESFGYLKKIKIHGILKHPLWKYIIVKQQTNFLEYD